MHNTMMQTWQSGGETLGCWLSMPSTHAAEIVGLVGFDYVCVDMQHGVADYQVAVDMIGMIGATAGGATPIVRVPWNEPGIIGRMLDAGARGVVIPMVNSRAEAEAAVRACKYPPLGARSFGPVLAGTRASEPGSNYFETANDTNACIPMIETREAVEALDDILATPGVDAIYVGPADLSISYGYGPGYSDEHDDYREALEHIASACASHGVVPGIHCTAGLSANRRAKGFRMQTIGSDALAVGRGLREDLKTSRTSGLGDGGGSMAAGAAAAGAAAASDSADDTKIY